MIKRTGLIVLMCLWASAAGAQMPYLEEMKALGAVAGQGLACGASKYDQFEMLARAIMLTKAPNNAILQKGVYAYTEAKADTYLSKQMDAGFLCGETVQRFDSQDIFNITLYEDGTLKMPDGQIITPRMPYDASKIYRRDEKLTANLKAIYEGSTDKVRRQALQQGQKVAVPNRQTVNNAYAPRVMTPAPAEEAAVSESAIKHISRRKLRY